MMSDLWKIIESEFDPQRQHHSETVFTIGNGYLGTRGVLEEGYPKEERATFIHGIFDDVPIVFTELANVPDWMEIEIILDGERFGLEHGTIRSYYRELNLWNGKILRTVVWESPQGKTYQVEMERFASQADQHLAMIRGKITPLGQSALVEIRGGLNGEADNLGLKHWTFVNHQVEDTRAVLMVETRKTHIQLAAGMRLEIFGGKDVQSGCWNLRNHPVLWRRVRAENGETVEFTKEVQILTNREIPTPMEGVITRMEYGAVNWLDAWEMHRKVWEKTWERCDVVIEGDDEAQLALRFNLFQLLVAAPRKDERVNLGAKTLSGYGYRGHAFWDTEIFMLPFFTYTQPEIARNLLSYRYHCLEGAQKKAVENGYRGAQYPWESAAFGEEVTPTWVPHYADRTKQIRIWTGDIEIHISADVLFAIHQYWKASSDDQFMLERGLVIAVETARFWCSRAEWNESLGMYEFTNVIGPDEYHDHVDNNAFTNVMARWNLTCTEKLVDWALKNYPDEGIRILNSIGYSSVEADDWKRTAEKIIYREDLETGLVEQFDGYFQRRDLNLMEMEPRSHSVQALLGIEETNETQILKQPDVLMLFYLLPELADARKLKINYDYYTARTDHTFGSSLGPSIQAIMACRMGDEEAAYEHFMRAARADLQNVRGNAEDGIHGASAGGLWQAVVFGFGGLSWSEDGKIELNPVLPKHWKKIRFKIVLNGIEIPVEVNR